MLTVTLVATFAATSLWQQWRGVEVEAAERSRTQLAWVLTGALDWARLILREDARSGQVDHLSEPWALPLQESRLSSFLALDKNNTDDAQEAFLSGQITDLQSRMNVLNLVDNGKLYAPALRAFGKLFKVLNLPESQLNFLAENLRAASVAGNAQSSAPLLPQRVEQLAWLGLPALTLQTLTPYITVLPVRTPVNLNTASAEVIHASVPGLEMAQAQRMVAERASAHFRTLDDAVRATGVPAHLLDTSQLSVASRFFEVRGRLRLEQSIVQERSLVERQGLEVKALWREREVVDPLMAYAPAFLQ
jgi:general secretion pathway protein K